MGMEKEKRGGMGMEKEKDRTMPAIIGLKFLSLSNRAGSSQQTPS